MVDAMDQAGKETPSATKQGAAPIAPGALVIVVLHSPREKYWGALGEINAAGIFLRALDLHAFDDWMSALANDEMFFGLTDMFLPMWRVERLTRDERTGDIPSLAEQFEGRTGRSLGEFL